MASNPFFPFHALGYHCNPFRSLTDEEWADIAVLPPRVLDAAATDAHLQFIGRKGRGKSSMLRGLAAHFEEQGAAVVYEYLHVGVHHFTTDPAPLDMFVIDEVQRLGPAERLRLVNHARRTRLIISTHLTYTPDFLLRGLPLRTIRMRNHDAATLRAIINARLDYFALPNAENRLTLTDDAVEALHQRFGDDLRATEWHLYHVFQNAEGTAPITPARLAALEAAAGSSPGP